jgi:hypothetical protein
MVVPVRQVADGRKCAAAYLTRTGLGSGPVACEFRTVASPSDLGLDASDAGVVYCCDRNLYGPAPPAHPLSAGERTVKRDRWWGGVVDGYLHYVGVYRCSGGALGRGAEDQLVDSRRAFWCAKRHGPATVVEPGRGARLAVHQSHNRRPARECSDPCRPTAVVACHPTPPAHGSDRGSGWRHERVAGVVESRVGPADQAVADACRRAASRWARGIRAAGISERRPGGAAVAEQSCGIARNNRVWTRRGGPWRDGEDETACRDKQDEHSRPPS